MNGNSLAKYKNNKKKEVADLKLDRRMLSMGLRHI